MSTDSEIISKLKKLSDGLLYMSESEYPFEVMQCDLDKDILTKRGFLKLLGKPQDAEIESLSLEQFFKPITEIQDWYEEQDITVATKFQKLLDVIKQFRNVKVYRIGKIEIDIHILGIAPDGKIVGLSTKAIET